MRSLVCIAISLSSVCAFAMERSDSARELLDFCRDRLANEEIPPSENHTFHLSVRTDSKQDVLWNVPDLLPFPFPPRNEIRAATIDEAIPKNFSSNIGFWLKQRPNSFRVINYAHSPDKVYIQMHVFKPREENAGISPEDEYDGREKREFNFQVTATEVIIEEDDVTNTFEQNEAYTAILGNRQKFYYSKFSRGSYRVPIERFREFMTLILLYGYEVV